MIAQRCTSLRSCAPKLAPCSISGRRAAIVRRLQPARVLSESADMAIGTLAPEFELMEPNQGQPLSLYEYVNGANATLVM